MATLFNRVAVLTTTLGTGTVTLGAAVPGFRTFAAASVPNGTLVPYLIVEGTAWEIGTGTYTSSGTTLSRTPTASSIGGGAITLAGSARVFITARAADIVTPTGTQTLTNKTLTSPVINTSITGTAVTQSATDTTSGRLLKFGDFGIGFSLNEASDWDNQLNSAFLDVPSTASNRPNVAVNYSGLAIRGNNANNVTQIACANNATNRLYSRARVATVWSPWREIYTQISVVGTVSQSGGVPTGAAMQGNAATASPTGGYTERLADGFQTVHHTLTSSSSADTTWTYNSAFLSGSTPVISLTPVGDADHFVRLVSRDATSCVFSIRDSSSNRVAVSVDAIARGRWSNLT